MRLKPAPIMIHAPIKRKESYPCFSEECAVPRCLRREYKVYEGKGLVLSSCTRKKCGKRRFKSDSSFDPEDCVKGNCAKLVVGRRVYCKLRPLRIGRLDLGRKATTIRQSGRTGGWHYRRLK